MVSKNPTDVINTFADTDSLLGVYDGKPVFMNIPLSGDETVEITEYAPGEIRLNVTTMSRRLLVILNRYDSRWSAMIDGKVPSTLFPVNYLFMGLAVPGGTHDVVLSYH